MSEAVLTQILNAVQNLQADVKGLKESQGARFENIDGQLVALTQESSMIKQAVMETQQAIVVGFRDVGHIVEAMKEIAVDVDEQAAASDLLDNKIRSQEGTTFEMRKTVHRLDRELRTLKANKEGT